MKNFSAEEMDYVVSILLPVQRIKHPGRSVALSLSLVGLSQSNQLQIFLFAFRSISLHQVMYSTARLTTSLLSDFHTLLAVEAGGKKPGHRG